MGSYGSAPGTRRLGSRLVAVLAVWLLAGLGVVVGALPASAAAGGLLTSDPQSRQELDDVPGAVTLVFDGKVDAEVAKILVLDAKGANVTDGPLIVESTNVTTQLEDGLPKGTYTVHYRVDGKGGEPRGGAFQFSYGGGTFVDPPDRSWSGTANEPDILRGDDPNGPEQSAPADETPGVEVTSSDKPDRPTTQAPPTSTATDPDDPDDPTSTETTGSDDPSAATATAVPADSGVGRGFLIGGVVLLLGVGGAAFAYYRSTRKGTHA